MAGAIVGERLARANSKRTSLFSNPGQSAFAESVRVEEDVDGGPDHGGHGRGAAEGPPKRVSLNAAERTPSKSSTASRSWSESWSSRLLRSRSRRSGQAPTSPCRQKAWQIIHSRGFDLAICFVVAVNSVIIGLEQSYRLEGESTPVLDILEHCFLVVYIMELGLRFYAMRCECLFSNWVRFDILIILIGIITNWVLVPFFGEIDQIGSLLVLRMARLLRLARILKLFVRCEELLMLVHGLFNSVSTMFYTLVLLGLILYVLGCMSLEVLTLGMRNREFDNPDIVEIINENFSTLPVAMLSLVQFITFDNVVYIYKPLIAADPTLAVFFMAVMLVVGIVFMNLVTAVIVNSSLEQALQDKDIQRAAIESKRKKLINNLREAFYRADADMSGEITREELEQISAEDKESLKQMLGIDDLVDIFDSLDVDGDGEIGIEEFCSGIERIVTSETSIEFKRMERLMLSIHKQLRDVARRQDDLRKWVVPMMQTDACEEESLHGMASEGNGEPDAPETTVVRPMPPWANHMILEMKEACNADMRLFMGEVFASLAHVQPQLAVQAGGCSSSAARAGEPQMPASHSSFFAALLEGQKPGVWEVLPPTERPRAPEMLPSAAAETPLPRPRAQRARPEQPGGKPADSERSGQQSEREVEPSRPRAAADDCQRPDGGSAVPAPSKLTLLPGDPGTEDDNVCDSSPGGVRIVLKHV